MRDWLIHLPSELTESDLLDMVEGTLPAHREPVAIAALKAEPRLGLLIKQMRADRDGAAALATPEQAPSDVGERVLSVIDRRVIRELDAAAQQQTQHIPVSTLTIHEPSALELFMQSAWTKRLAVAAGLLIAVGVGALAVRVAMQKPEAPGRGGTPGVDVTAATPGAGTPTASVPGPTPVPDAPLATASPSIPETSDTAPSVALGHVDGTQSFQPGADATTPAPGVDVASTPAATVSAQPELTPAVKSSGISIAVAARLAREGRLAIVVHGSNVDEIASRAQTLAKATQVAGAVVCRTLPPDKVPQQAMALLASDATSGSTPGREPTNVAGDQASGPDMSLSSIAPEAAPAPAPRAPAPAFMATLDASERTLAAVRTYLERGSGEAGARVNQVEFRMLERPIEQAMALDPESILWWNTPASRWARMSGVPIVIDNQGK